MRKRQWKKILSVVLALAMVFSMNTAVFADEVTDPVAVAEPTATEEPVAEAPAETEAPAAEAPAEETEEAVAEEPAASEAAAEETIEEPAAEAPAAAEVAEPEVAEEPAGDGFVSNFDFNNPLSDAKFTVSAIDAGSGYEGFGSTAILAASGNDASTGIYGISVNGKLPVNTWIVLEATDEVTIEKVYVSGDSATDVANIKGVFVSGNKISLKDVVVYQDGPDAQLGSAVAKVREGQIMVTKEGVPSFANDWSKELVPEAFVYNKKGEVRVKAVSADLATISFNQSFGTIVSDNGANIGLNNFKYGSEQSGGAQVYDFAKLKKEQSGFATADAAKLFGLNANDYYTFATKIDAELQEGTNVPIGSVESLSKDSVEIEVNTHDADVWAIVDNDDLNGATDSIEIMRGIASGEIPTVAKGYDKVAGSKISANGLVPLTGYTAILGNREAGKITAYGKVEFTTQDEPVSGNWVATNDWRAYANSDIPENAKTVSVNGDIVSINGLADDDAVVLVASDNATKLAKVFVNNFNIGSVTLSANKSGVLVENATIVLAVGGVPVEKTFKAKSDSVVVDGEKAELGANLKNGVTVYQAEPLSLTESANFVVDYEKTQAALVKNTGKVVGTDVEFTAKGTKVDVDKIVESSNVIIEYTDAAAKGYHYGVVGSFGAWATAPITSITVSKTTAKDFTFEKHTGNEYGLATSKEADAKTVSYNVLTELSKIASNNVTVTSSNSAENGKTQALEPGATYYVFTKTAAEEGRFTRYSEKPVAVTLGAIKTITIKPRHNGQKVVLSGNTVSNADFEIFVEKKEVVSANGSDFDLDTEIDKAALISYFALSGNDFKTEKKADTNPAVKSGEYKLTVSGASSSSEKSEVVKSGFEKNEYHFVYVENTFYVGTADSKLEVKTNGNYYYAQSVGEFTIGGDKFFEVRLDGKSEPYAASALKAKVSANAFTTGGVDPGAATVDKTTSANGSFYVKFYDSGESVSSGDATKVDVTARPVYVGAKKNFFKKTGDTVSDAKITVKAEDFELLDVDDEFALDHYVKGDLALDKTSVTTAKGSDIAQVYDLTIASSNYASESVKNDAGKNIIISAGSAEGFAYYVFPVYQATFNGHFKSAKYEGETIKKDAVKTVSSDAAKKIADYEKNEVNKKDVAYTATAVVTLPTDVEVNGDFMGWKSSLTGKIVNEKTDTISSDVIYSASVKERVPGFTSSQNSLQVEFDADNIVFTGKKHVTDPGYQLGQRYGENGVENAITALIKAANAGKPDITLNISVGNKTLLEGYDYKAVYKNNINAYNIEDHKSDANFSKKAPQVTITFKGGYAQYPSITKYFSIEPASLTATDGAAQGEPVASVYVKEGAKLASVKTGLFNGYTGAPLVANKNGKKDVVIKINGSDPTGAFVKGNEYKVTVEGKNNYKETTDEVELIVVGKKDFKAVKAAANKAKDFVLDSYTNTDTYEAATEDERFVKTVIEQIGKNKTIKNAGVNVEEIITSGTAEIRTSAVKNVDYIVPGAKKINYAVDIPVTSGEGEAEKTTVYAVTGTIAYTVPKAKATDIEIKWADVPEGGVPYVATGATLGYETSYKGEAADLSRILTVTYSKNKNPGKDGVATVKPVKKAYIEGTFDKKTFAVGKAKLTEDNIALCYVVKADKKDNDAKTQKAIAKRGSVVIKDELGNVLKAGKDYDLKLGRINVMENGNDTIDLAVSGKGKYDGSFNLDPDVLDEAFLGNLTLKNKATGANKNFSLKEMTDLEEGEISTNKIAKDHSIDVFNGRTALGTAGTDYDIVITTAGNGGFAFVTAVGIDGGKFGGSDVLAKKAIKVKVK